MKQRFRDLVGVLCTGGRLRLWLVQHGPCADSENPASLIYSMLGLDRRWGLFGGAEGARVGPHGVRDGGDTRADCRDVAFGRATLSCALGMVFFVALFTASGLLFRQASLAGLK